MNIKAFKLQESVICVFPDGHEIEVTVVSMYGEDVRYESDIRIAMKVVQENLPALLSRL